MHRFLAKTVLFSIRIFSISGSGYLCRKASKAEVGWTDTGGKEKQAAEQLKADATTVLYHNRIPRD